MDRFPHSMVSRRTLGAGRHCSNLRRPSDSSSIRSFAVPGPLHIQAVDRRLCDKSTKERSATFLPLKQGAPPFNQHGILCVEQRSTARPFAAWRSGRQSAYE